MGAGSGAERRGRRGTAGAERRGRRGTAGAAVGLLALQNVAANELVPEALYVPANVTGTALLLVLARADGARPGDLGAARRDLRAGVRLGGGLAALVAAGIALGAAVPGTRALFEDERVAELEGAALAYQVLVRIPLGTVLLEEVAFRGVLPALLGARLGAGRGALASSALFGLWHVLPTLSALDANAPGTGAWAKAGAAAGAVAATGAAGLFLTALRARSRSLAAPALLHWAANGLATVAAFVVLRAR